MTTYDKIDRHEQDVNIKDFEDILWLSVFSLEMILITAAIITGFLTYNPIKSRILQRKENEAIKVEIKDKKEDAERRSGNINSEMDARSLQVPSFFSRRVSIREEMADQRCCFCCHCKHTPKFWKCFSLTINIIIFIFDMYTIISEAIVLRSARFQGTQFIIYNNSKLINSEFLIYDRILAEQIVNKNNTIVFSSIANFTEVLFNTSSKLNISTCYEYKYEEIVKAKIIYKLLPGAFTLLFLSVFINTCLIYLDIIDILVWDFIPHKWINILLSVGLKAFSSAKLGFSFFGLHNDCLNPITYFEVFYYVYMIYSVAYLLVWTVLIILLIALSVHGFRSLLNKEGVKEEPIKNRKTILNLMIKMIVGILIIAGVGILCCGLIGFIIFKIIWILNGIKSLIPAITSILSIVGGVV